MLIVELFEAIKRGDQIIHESVNWDEVMGLTQFCTVGQSEEHKQRAMELRNKVADLIEKHEELWDQSSWQHADEPGGTIDSVDCGTACCVAGWAARFVAAHHEDVNVPATALASLWCDRKEIPSFDHTTPKEEILRILRS